MKKQCYDVRSLEQSVRGLEDRFGMDSEAFMVAYRAEDEAVLRGIPGFSRHVWADFCVEIEELRGEAPDDDFSSGVKRELEPA